MTLSAMQRIQLDDFVLNNHVGAPAYAPDLCRRAIEALYNENGDEQMLISLPKEANIPCAVAMPDGGKGLPLVFIFEMFHLWDLLLFWEQRDCEAGEQEWQDEECE